jgi:hypothetical protein
MEIRLGDIIDDFCIKCKRIMNHAVVSMLNGEPAKVRCRTCHNDHDYRHEQAPPPKVDTRKAALFNEMLAKVAPGATSAPVPETAVEEDPPEELPEEPPEDLPPVEEPKPKKVKAAPAKAPSKDNAKDNAKPPAKAPAKDKPKPKGRK